MTFLWGPNIVQSVMSLKHVVQQGCRWLFLSTFTAQRSSPIFPGTISPPSVDTKPRILSMKVRSFLASWWWSMKHMLDTAGVDWTQSSLQLDNSPRSQVFGAGSPTHWNFSALVRHRNPLSMLSMPESRVDFKHTLKDNPEVICALCSTFSMSPEVSCCIKRWIHWHCVTNSVSNTKENEDVSPFLSSLFSSPHSLSSFHCPLHTITLSVSSPSPPTLN